MTYSAAIVQAFKKFKAVEVKETDICAVTPAQKMVATKAFRKLAKLIEAEGMSVNKVVPDLLKMEDEDKGWNKPVMFYGWNKGTFE